MLLKDDDKLRIVNTIELLKLNLEIPTYQRPYRWTKESSLVLFKDIYSAFKEDKEKEYRIGTIILHKEKNNGDESNEQVSKQEGQKENEYKYNIVDGQQRITTISILLYCLNNLLDGSNGKKFLKEIANNSDYEKLLNIDYSELSYKCIVENYQILNRKCNELGEDLKGFAKYLLDKCTFVKIVTDSEQEAFQFFDSQNSRGKDLAPHDLLKAYHLREMNDEEEYNKIKLINKWENIEQDKLKSLFANNLYPLIRWYKNKSGLYYSKNDIGNFKGLKQNSTYNYSVYHKAANLYIEKYNKDGMFELVNGTKILQFQLTQPLIAGRRFFEYSSYYFELLEKIEHEIKNRFKESDLLVNGGTGDKYIYNLFLNLLLFYVDRFGFNKLTGSIINFFYKWCYSLRLVMYAVYQETINNYALGNGRINKGLNLFQIISEINNPNELELFELEEIKEGIIQVDINKYNSVLSKIWRKK